MENPFLWIKSEKICLYSNVSYKNLNGIQYDTSYENNIISLKDYLSKVIQL